MKFFRSASFRKSAIFLLVLFCAYFGSITFFPHTHIVDGVKIVHSHPYRSLTGQPSGEHKHSGNAYNLIHFLSHLTILVTVSFAGFSCYKDSSSQAGRFLPDPVHIPSRILYNIRPRAPSL